MKGIEIEEMRISPNGEYLEFIINCPSEYKFTVFDIYIITDERKGPYHITDQIFKDPDTDNRFAGMLPVDLLDVSGPEIYRVHLEARSTFDNSVLEKDAYISDVSRVYDCLADDILEFSDRCADKDIQDRVIRNYLMLYAHQEALRLGYLDEAKKWFKLITNCFKNKCITSNDRNLNISCGCHD